MNKKNSNTINIIGRKDKMSQRKLYVFYMDKQSEGEITSSKINVTKKKYMVIKIDDISKKVKSDNQYKRMSIVLAVIYIIIYDYKISNIIK